MADRSAVIFLLDDTFRTGSPDPLMLQNIMGTPMLKWLSYALAEQQVRRFFLVCAPKYTQQAQAQFPPQVQVVTASDENPSDALHVFLSTAEDEESDVLVVTGPTLYAPFSANHDPGVGPTPANACMVSREALMQALDETAPIGHFLRRAGDACTDREGFFSLYSARELSHWQPILNRDLLRRLEDAGVEVWDENTTYVGPEVRVGIGTALLPGTVLEGSTVIGYGSRIGPNTHLTDTRVGNHSVVEQSCAVEAVVGNQVQVGPFAHLRPGTVLGNRVKAGAFVELKQTTLDEGAQVPHLSYLGDAHVGKDANIGCGTVTANFDRVTKSATTIEDNAFVGCSTTLVAPVTVGKGAYIGAGSVITESVPAQALGIERSKQLTRKEWALKHKINQE